MIYDNDQEKALYNLVHTAQRAPGFSIGNQSDVEKVTQAIKNFINNGYAAERAEIVFVSEALEEKWGDKLADLYDEVAKNMGPH